MELLPVPWLIVAVEDGSGFLTGETGSVFSGGREVDSGSSGSPSVRIPK